MTGAPAFGLRVDELAQFPEPAPLDPASTPPLDRYCDLVMTGGVTDGVLYPWAVVELARAYRFHAIGGTSVGAMAAALTAAAEYSRRYGSNAGFDEVLLKVPGKLAENVLEGTRLFSLFQPAPQTRRLFELFVSFSNGVPTPMTAAEPSAAAAAAPDDQHSAIHNARKRYAQARKIQEKARKFLEPVRTIDRIYHRPGLLGGAVGLGVVLAIGLGVALAVGAPVLESVPAVLLLALPAMLVAGVIAIAIAVYRDFVNGVVPNGFGMCTGGRVPETAHGQPSLVEWLHEGIQAAAGKPFDQPLTFRDLWEAPGGPAADPMRPAPQARRPRSIDLRMVTTNLTHTRPYELPLQDDASRLFFKLSELKPYFPKAVIDHLKAKSVGYEFKSEHSDPELAKEECEEFRELPRAELPVVVAARLSLSFPLLFSAVPLWAIDYEPRCKKQRQLRRCWFSDGGLCSNFPIHMFDAVVPQWPTFGISLGAGSIWRRKKEEGVWITRFHTQGRGDTWQRFGDEIAADDPRKTVPPLKRLVGFALSIMSSAKDWNDKLTMRMPGVRDRVVHVDLVSDVGGLNLQLPGRAIMKLARDCGQPAGKKLVEKFIDTAADKPSTAWEEHRWVRFNTFLAALRQRLEALTAATERADYSMTLSEQIERARAERPLRGRDRAGSVLTPKRADELEQLLGALKDLEARFARCSIPQSFKPVPPPSLRIRPPL